MKEFKDKFLVVALGEVMSTRGNFPAALKEAKAQAEKLGVNVTIDAIEQVSVTTVHPTGYTFGRTE